MKKGYSVENWIIDGDIIILVRNNTIKNTVINFGFELKKYQYPEKNDLGVWKIKNKN